MDMMPEMMPVAGPKGPDRARRILFFGEFTVETAERCCQELLEFTDRDATRPIDLIINSNGGDLQSLFAICDVIEHIRPPVRTVGMGMIASCGLLLLMAGARGHRRISRNASVLSHQFTGWGGWYKYGELIAKRPEEDMTQERVLRHYERHTRKSERHIRKHLVRDVDTWLSPAQAVRHGMADKVMRGAI